MMKSEPPSVDTQHTYRPGGRIHHVKAIKDPLYVVVAIENPNLFEARYRHYRAFAKHIQDSGAILYTVEVVMGNRGFEVTKENHPRHIQLRANTVLWRKENLQNIGVRHLPHDWKYVMLADGDFLNTRPDWVQATLQALQRHKVVQTLSTYSTLRSDHTVESNNDCFVYAWVRGGRVVGPDGIKGATGGQWAYTRDAWETLHGVLETPALGSADWYMTYALAGAVDRNKDTELARCAPRYIETVEEWRQRATKINRSIHYVQNHGMHYWHGAYKTRGYGWRWKILATHAFDPDTDLIKQPSGLLELAGNKPTMAHEIEDYFASRDEDALT